MSQQKHEALVTQSVPEHVTQEHVCPIAKLQENASLLSVDIGSGTPSVVDHVTDSLYSGSPNRVVSMNTPKKTPTASLKADIDSIGEWSDTLSVTLQNNPRSTDSVSDERKSLLDVRKLSTDRRDSSSASRIVSFSPRPGSKGSRRSRRPRRKRSSQKSHESPSTRGEMLMEMARQDSAKSHQRTKSSSSNPSNRDSVREKNQTSKKQRKNSDTTTSSSSSAASQDGEGGAFPRKGKRGYMTADEAVNLGDMVCGCVLKDKLIYFIKPIIFLVFGSLLIAGGLALTILHFVYEDSLKQKNPPFFTYGPITFSTGVILFMVGLVWFPIKQQKWKDGLASPMLAALAKWRLASIERGELEMKNIGASKTSTTEYKVDETSLVTSGKESEKCDTAETAECVEKTEKE